MKSAFYAQYEMAFGCLRTIINFFLTIIVTLLLQLHKMTFLTSGTLANVSVECVDAGRWVGTDNVQKRDLFY